MTDKSGLEGKYKRKEKQANKHHLQKLLLGAHIG